jgi:imidazolonepropionase-like amidohydrolase
MISQTSGHGDFRLRSDIPRAANAPLSLVESTGVAMIADGETEVLRRVREQLMLGATQIKMLAGGGVASLYDPLDSTQYSERELHAGVEAAADWGTYVMAHVYTPKGIQRAIRAGVRSIEHGQLADEESARMMRDAGTWWSLQPFLQDEDSNVSRCGAQGQPEDRIGRHGEGVCAGAKVRHQDGLGYGYPVQREKHAHAGAPAGQADALLRPAHLAGAGDGTEWRTAGPVRPARPYPGTLGRLAPGALADLLVADGDPAKNLDFLARPEDKLLLIMKNGRIYKDNLSAPLAG